MNAYKCRRGLFNWWEQLKIYGKISVAFRVSHDWKTKDAAELARCRYCRTLPPLFLLPCWRWLFVPLHCIWRLVACRNSFLVCFFFPICYPVLEDNDTHLICLMQKYLSSTCGGSYPVCILCYCWFLKLWDKECWFSLSVPRYLSGNLPSAQPS